MKTNCKHTEEIRRKLYRLVDEAINEGFTLTIGEKPDCLRQYAFSEIENFLRRYRYKNWTWMR